MKKYRIVFDNDEQKVINADFFEFGPSGLSFYRGGQCVFVVSPLGFKHVELAEET